jgi:hypothetical protein
MVKNHQFLELVEWYKGSPVLFAAGLGLKAVWLGAEQFGNIIGLTKPRGTTNEPKSSDQVSKPDMPDSSVHHIFGFTVPQQMQRAMLMILLQQAFPGPNVMQGFLSRKDAIAAIKEDYDSNYFVSGRGGSRWIS